MLKEVGAPLQGRALSPLRSDRAALVRGSSLPGDDRSRRRQARRVSLASSGLVRSEAAVVRVAVLGEPSTSGRGCWMAYVALDIGRASCRARVGQYVYI